MNENALTISEDICARNELLHIKTKGLNDCLSDEATGLEKMLNWITEDSYMK